MDNIQMEIDRFIISAKLSHTTKQRYCKYLDEFTKYLSYLTNTNLEDLHYERIYRIHSQSGAFLCYKPIDAYLLDKYLTTHIEKGYNWLRLSKSAMSSLFNYLHRRYDFPNLVKKMTFNPKDYRTVKRPQRILSRREILLFLQSLIKHSKDLKRDVLLFSLLLSTGMRISEALNLKVSHVNCTDDAVFLTKTKTKVQRMVMLRDSFGLAINEYVRVNRLSDNDYLFSTQGNRQFTRVEVQTLLNNFLMMSGLEPINLHGLRHSFATLMFESGSELLVIQQLLGHSALGSTKTYVHPNYIRNYGVEIKENQTVYRIAKDLLMESDK
ncbi:tyrosine-type recombinase/integrase [Brevibacillus sp. DP1.3A]|uniref:tyrosine-type recombinase/integrase n=1 Tax=Brevibacillus sp. DP1.3A TaxID=2738867 RepID=UPI00156A910B|nr:tyrosine-type recombinase/integrase [Brevibacillus sp. DP1.3A]UED72187.1 tyrosine-type recombinase/integrase [Brevibacillus sp. DP1.3A]